MVLQFMRKKDFILDGPYPEHSVDSYLVCFQLALLHAVSYFFFLNQSPSLLMHWFFILF